MRPHFFNAVLSLVLVLSACGPYSSGPRPDKGTDPTLNHFEINAQGYDTLLGNYNEDFDGQAAFNGSLLQLWSYSDSPNRILEITYHGGGSIPAGTYQAVGSIEQLTDPATQVVVTYTLEQGDETDPQCYCYYFEYYATGGTVTISEASSEQLTGDIYLTVERYDYYAELTGFFKAGAGQ